MGMQPLLPFVTSSVTRKLLLSHQNQRSATQSKIITKSVQMSRNDAAKICAHSIAEMAKSWRTKILLIFSACQTVTLQSGSHQLMVRSSASTRKTPRKTMRRIRINVTHLKTQLILMLTFPVRMVSASLSAMMVPLALHPQLASTASGISTPSLRLSVRARLPPLRSQPLQPLNHQPPPPRSSVVRSARNKKKRSKKKRIKKMKITTTMMVKKNATFFCRILLHHHCCCYFHFLYPFLFAPFLFVSGTSYHRTPRWW